jgi:hypothetical protein
MFVYGISCKSAHLVDLPPRTEADYYKEHSLLVFSSYAKPACIRNYGPTLTPYFLHKAKQLIENTNRLITVDLEHPYITEDEDAAVKVLQQLSPESHLSWYSIP